MDNEARVRESFAVQARWCEQLGSPFTARLLDGLEAGLDHSTKTGRKILRWPGMPDALGDAVALRLASALHALARRGDYRDLTRMYPPNPLPETQMLASVALAVIHSADAEIEQWLDHPPQTNEVARSAILFPGLMQIAAETELPLSLYEIGCSAGLNLIPDRYSFLLGGVPAGRVGASVVLAPDWSGNSPGGANPVIVSRRGCDRNVLDVSDAAHAERIKSYVWPDQVDRINRILAALELARMDPPTIDQADAGDWIEAMIEDDGAPDVTRVVFHSIAFQYFQQQVQHRITARIEAAGRKATARTPLAWLWYEQFEDKGPRLALRLWPGGMIRILAEGDAHCTAVRWF